jgi:DNA polymerase elongation subunit (family B)
MNSPKVLVFDIETSPITAYVWGLKDQNISLSQIVKDWQVMAWGAKWLDAPASSMMYQDVRHTSERTLLKGIWKLLDEADIVITQNGKSFDSKKLNARFIHYGMPPPSPYKHIDTYLVVKQAADFTSNKLEYLTDKLCTKYKKLSHSKFPGMSLWNECLRGNKSAWNEMRIYNIHDVLSTEELYNKIRAWGPQNMPKIYTAASTCSSCGHSAQRRGTEMKGKSLVQRIRCTNSECGKWGTESIAKEKT